MSTPPPSQPPWQNPPPSPILALSSLLLSSFSILLSFHASQTSHEDIQILAFTITIFALPGGLLGFFINLATEAHAQRAFLSGMVTGHVALFWIAGVLGSGDRWWAIMVTGEAILVGFGVGGSGFGLKHEVAGEAHAARQTGWAMGAQQSTDTGKGS